MRISFILVEQFIWKSGTVCSSVPSQYHKGSQINKKILFVCLKRLWCLMTFRSLQSHLQLLISQFIMSSQPGFPGSTVCSWIHRSSNKQECWQILPGEKGRNCDVPTSVSKKDARTEATQCSAPSFSHPCIQSGLTKPHVWPCWLAARWASADQP